MLKKKKYKKIGKGSLKCVNTFKLFGYENLRFKEIEGIIAKYVDFHIPIGESAKEMEFINTSTPKRVDKPSLKEFQKIVNTSNGKTSGTLTSTGKAVPIKAISISEYLSQQAQTVSNFNISRPDTHKSNSRHSNGKPNARHSTFDPEPMPANRQPNVQDYNDPLVIWIILYMIHLILTDHQDDKEWYDSPIGTPISSEVLERIFGNRRKIALAKEIADFANILERFPANPEGHISDRFRISAALRNKRPLGRVIRYPVDDPKVSGMLLEAYNRRLDKKPLDAVSKQTLKILQTLRIRGEEARKFINDQYNKEYAREISKKKPNATRLARHQAVKDSRHAFIQSVEHIEEDAFVTRDDFSGRLYSTFTMSPKELRPFLYFDGCDEDLYIVDLSNAMAVFMVITLMEHYQKNYWKKDGYQFSSVITFLQLLRKMGNYEDAIRYITLVINGRFYGEMHRLMQEDVKNPPIMDGEAKKNLKTRLCRHVFYGKNWWNKKFKYKAQIEKVFEAKFPNVYRVVADVKRNDYKELAQVLFKKEVSIFVDGILKDMIRREKKPFILSIHDGLLVRASDVQDVVNRLSAAFKRWDMQATISVENIRTGEAKREILNKLPAWQRLPLIKYVQKGKEYTMWAKQAG